MRADETSDPFPFEEVFPMRVLLALLLALVFSLPAAAEYYQYTTPEGEVVFTDDFTKLPAEAREHYENVDVYGEYPTVPEEGTAVDRTPYAAPGEEGGIPEQATQEELERLVAEVAAERQALVDAFDRLRGEQTRLNEARSKIDSTPKLTAFNEAVSRFNEEQEAYNRRRETFNEKVRELNRRNLENFAEASE